jgi:curved DNA-binding protein CbpA
MAKDYYAVLGVARGASAAEIREHFLRLARSRHPDRFRGNAKAAAEAEFQSLTEAFNVLSDPERRRLHDLELARPDLGARSAAEDGAQMAKFFVQRGIKIYKEHKYVEAADNFDRATKADPDNAQSWHHLALACSHYQRFQARALAAITKACELEKMNPGYLKLAGKLFAAAGMTARAERYYNEALTWGGEDATVRQALDELGRAQRRGTGLFGKAGG